LINLKGKDSIAAVAKVMKEDEAVEGEDVNDMDVDVDANDNPQPTEE
jgi:DNA gyrase subunit A